MFSLHESERRDRRASWGHWDIELQSPAEVKQVLCDQMKGDDDDGALWWLSGGFWPQIEAEHRHEVEDKADERWHELPAGALMSEGT